MAMILVVACLIIVIFSGGEFIQRTLNYKSLSINDFNFLKPAHNIFLNTRREIPRPISNQQLLESTLPLYDLRIDAKDLNALHQEAELVMALSESTPMRRNYVPAMFRMGDEWVPVQVKLRGMKELHYVLGQPSLRIKFPKHRMWHGKKQINITDPYDKGLIADVVTNSTLKEMGLMTWESQFVLLRLNGEIIGVFQEIEQFGRGMIDRQGRSEGGIYSGLGQEFGKGIVPNQRIQSILDWGSKGLLPENKSNSDFLTKNFDKDYWASAGAMMAVLGSRHGWGEDNLRMYWDPARAKFEPIPWDYFYSKLNPAESPEGEVNFAPWSQRFGLVEDYRLLRDQKIWRILNESVPTMIADAKTLYESLKTPLQNHLKRPLMKSNDFYLEEYTQTLESNQQYLKTLLTQQDLRIQYSRNASGGLSIYFENWAKSAVEIQDVQLSNGITSVLQPLKQQIRVNGLWQGSPGKATLYLANELWNQLMGFRAQNMITGQYMSKKDMTLEFKRTVPLMGVVNDVQPKLDLLPDNVKRYNKEIVFGPGRVELKKTLEVPVGHRVRFMPGLELLFHQGVALIVRDDLIAIGSEENPIAVKGYHGRKDFEGIFVQGMRLDKVLVVLRHFRIHGGKGGEYDGIVYSSPLSIHDGRVHVRMSEFKDSQAEDALNLKYCEFSIQESQFENSRDDAVDIDFGRGTIEHNTVHTAGGDGLDISGAAVRIKDNSIQHFQDKGLSIGERSRAIVHKNVILHGRMGIAVKDSSFAKIQSNTLEDLTTGIATYIKKPTFDKPRITLHQNRMIRVKSPHLNLT